MAIYNNIASVLGWEQSPDTEEGIFPQPEEAAAIDAALGVEDNTEALTAAQGQVNELTNQLAAANDSLATANSRITELEAENARLGQESSGKGTNLTVTEDPKVEEEKTPSYLDESNPINQLVDQRIR